jgi:WD40 repeat protein
MNYQVKQKLDNGHNDGVWSFAWAQNNIVSGSIDGYVKYWNLADGKTPFVSKKHKVGVTSIVALQDGSLAVACYQDSVIRFFDLINRTEKFTLNPGLFEAYSLSLSPGEDILVSGTSHGNINVWSMQEGYEKITSIPTQNKFILHTCFSLDNKLSMSTIEGTVNVFDMSTQQSLYKFDTLHTLPVRSTCFSPNGDLLFTSSDDRQIHILDLKTGKTINSFANDAMILNIDISPDNRHLVAGTGNNKVLLFDLGMRKRIQKYSHHNDMVWCVKYNHHSNSHFGEVFASSSDDSTVQVLEFV